MGAADLEPDFVNERRASQILPDRLRAGPHHRVDEAVRLYGPQHVFAVHSDFGSLEAQGDARPRRVVREGVRIGDTLPAADRQRPGNRERREDAARIGPCYGWPASSPWAARRVGGLFDPLGAMPDDDDPHGLPANSVEEPVRTDHYLAVGKVRELWKLAARVRITLQAAQATLGAMTEVGRRVRILATDELERIEELSAGRGREANPHPLCLLEEFVSLSENRIEAGTLAHLDLAVASCESPEDLEFLLGLLVGIHAEKHGCGAAPLGDDNRLARSAQTFENGCSVLLEV
jgi:hypothetical protein